ncbi:MAG: hypothetical protein ABIF18_00495, partial [archaeon]
MKNKLTILLVSMIVLVIAVFVVAQTQSELEAELSNLTQGLVDANYSWLVNYAGEVSNIFVENYSCNSTGYETSKVLTEGVHDLLFEFGGANATAHNFASYRTWFNSSWTYKKDITIDYTKVNGSQVNFPVLINTTDTDLITKAQADGDDIVFADSNDDKLDHEIEYYNS